jgi:hypothetical protein
MNFIRIGRLRAQLRLPHLRPGMSYENIGPLDDLFEAYGLAVIALERLRQAPAGRHHLICEYESTCLEVEEAIEFNMQRLANSVEPRG